MPIERVQQASAQKGHSHYKKSRHENSRCFTLRVLITPKTRDVSSDEKIAKFLEELRMSSLLVEPFPTQMQIYSTVCTAVLYTNLYETPIRPLARLIAR